METNQYVKSQARQGVSAENSKYGGKESAKENKITIGMILEF